MSHVLLLRAPSDAGTTTTAAVASGGDPYETHLTQAVGATTTSIPVYETVLTLDELQWILETGPAFHGYKGVIVTSKRAVDAWAKAALNVPPPVDERAHWTDIPFYTVGNSTASAVRSLSAPLSSAGAAHLAPTQVLGAEETGTAEQLAHFILAQLASQRERESGSLLLAPPTPSSSDGNGSSGAGSASSTSLTLTGSVSTDNLSVFTSLDSPTHGAFNPSAQAQAQGQGETKSPQSPVSPTPSHHRPNARARARSLRKPTKLLFLVGDKTRDVLPSLLSADAHVELDSVQVYTAMPSPSFHDALRNAVLAQPKVKDWWIAAFAPSGADYALPYLREHFTLLPSSSASSSASTAKDKKRFKKNKGPPVARLAAIGPTTAAHLREVLKLEVAAEAKKPNPEALVEAIRSTMGK